MPPTPSPPPTMLGPKLPGLSVFRVAARGLETQRVVIGAATDNIANASTTRTAEGEPYQVQRVLVNAPKKAAFGRALRDAQTRLATSDPSHRATPTVRTRGARAADGPTPEVVQEQAERLEYDPTHPDADAEGYVHYPDVNVVEEMAGMISANRLYEANLTTVQAVKDMLKRTLEI